MRKLLAKISIKIFDFIYKKQNEKHQKRMQKITKKIHSGSVCGGSVHTNMAATLTINSSAKEKTKANRERIEKILDLYYKDPKKIFDYIKGAKTPVYIIKKADKILNFINEDEGFILPKKGFEAFYLNLILNKKFSLRTSEMFVMRSYNVNIYALIYQFYNWYCYKMKLDGYENETQEQFKHVFEICETSKIDELSFNEILGLKSAIRRDIEAIEFVQQFAKKKTMAKKNLDKIKQGKAIKV